MHNIATAIIAATALLLFPGCLGANKKKKESAAATKPPEKTMADASGDVAYQAFVGRLRQAVANHDVAVIASMMTPNFGYYLGATPAEDRTGEGVFKFWDENGLWPELQAIVSEKFVPSGEFMVAPPQFVKDPATYQGYRAGLTRVGGSWRFAYFISG